MNEGRIKELIKETPVGWTRKHFEDKEKLICVVAAEAEHAGYRAGVEEGKAEREKLIEALEELAWADNFIARQEAEKKARAVLAEHKEGE